MGGYGMLGAKLGAGASRLKKKAGATRKRASAPKASRAKGMGRKKAPKPGVVGVVGPGGQKLDMPKKTKGTARKPTVKAKRAVTGRKRMRK